MQNILKNDAEFEDNPLNAQSTSLLQTNNDNPMSSPEASTDHNVVDEKPQIPLSIEDYEKRINELQKANEAYQDEIQKSSKDRVNFEKYLQELEDANFRLTMKIGDLTKANDDLARDNKTLQEENLKLKKESMVKKTFHSRKNSPFKHDYIDDGSSLLTNVLNRPSDPNNDLMSNRLLLLSGVITPKTNESPTRRVSQTSSDSPAFLRDRSYDATSTSFDHKHLRSTTSFNEDSANINALNRTRNYLKTLKTANVEELRKTYVYENVNSMYFGGLDTSTGLDRSRNCTQLLSNKRIPRFERKEIADKNGSATDNDKFRPKKLFEDFLVIGADKQGVLEYIAEHPKAIKGNLAPKVLWNFQPADSLAIPPKKSIENFVFPFGVRIKDVTDDQEERNMIKQKLFAQKGKPPIAKMMFPVLPADLEILKNEWHSSVEKMNSHHLIYFICVATHDYIVISPEEMTKHCGIVSVEGNRIYRIETALCFMSYFPIMPFFHGLIRSILGQFWHVRREKYLKAPENEEILDFMSSLNIYGERIKSSLQLIYDKCPTPQCNKRLEVTLNTYPQHPIYSTFSIPPINEVFSMEGLWESHMIFSYLNLKDIKWITSAILLEKKIVFFSKNITLLSATLSVFLTLIKPFQYTYPYIFNLPGVLLDICDAPGAGVTGINQGEDYFWNEDMIKLYPNCVFIFLDSKKAYSLEDTKMQKMPIFQDFDLRLGQSYKEINESSEEIKKAFTMSKIEKIKQTENVKLTKIEKNNSIADTVKYFRSHVIFMLFQLTWTEKIVKTVEQSALNSNFNVEKVLKDIIGQYFYGENKDFLKEFLQTQIFGYFIQSFLPDSFLFYQ